MWQAGGGSAGARYTPILQAPRCRCIPLTKTWKIKSLRCRAAREMAREDAPKLGRFPPLNGLRLKTGQKFLELLSRCTASSGVVFGANSAIFRLIAVHCRHVNRRRAMGMPMGGPGCTGESVKKDAPVECPCHSSPWRIGASTRRQRLTSYVLCRLLDTGKFWRLHRLHRYSSDLVRPTCDRGGHSSGPLFSFAAQ